jgi:4-hydroxy-3-polyprenylbenzoate decarboxylase
LAAEADFVIVGTIDPDIILPEGPFGDHLGYYSLRHDFPVLQVEAVYHRPDAIWHFTTVGRPPQEDTVFGHLIHELTAPALSTVLPAVKAVHAVDASGVHPLLLAQARERYTPYSNERRPQEILTAANAILGQGQLSLAKYLFIVSYDDDPFLDIHDIAAFFQHLLERVDWGSDLHFHTQTTYDTLDYSSGSFHRGSKLVVAAAGPPRRALPRQLPELRLGPEWKAMGMVFPGVVTLSGPAYHFDRSSGCDTALRDMAASIHPGHPLYRFPLWVVSDDAEFNASSLSNWLWTTFTRSNPAADVYGVGEFLYQKHWGCTGPLIIDARSKPHHAPVLEEDPDVARKVESWAARGGPLHGLF